MGQWALETPFPNTQVQHLPRAFSDHHPILLEKRSFLVWLIRDKGFRMLGVWLKQPNFRGIVEVAWLEGGVSFLSKLDRVQSLTIEWNKNYFDNIFSRKKRCLGCLSGLQKILEHRTSPFLSKLEETLLTELSEVLEHEETYWRHKARITWIKEGERNTRLFHMTALVRKKRK